MYLFLSKKVIGLYGSKLDAYSVQSLFNFFNLKGVAFKLKRNVKETHGSRN
jgi:hypothetical protein